MKHVVIFQDKKRLGPFLRTLSPSSSGDSRFYLAWDDTMDPALASRLERAGFKQKWAPRWESEFKDRFMQEYLGLIGQLSEANASSRLWWATDISSKNRFMSKLCPLLQQLVEIVDSAHKESFEYLLVLEPSWVIVPDLKKALTKKNMVVADHASPWLSWREVLTGRARKILSLLFHAARLCWRTGYARFHLKDVLAEKLQSQSPYYVVRSCVYDSSFAKDTAVYRDAFFGSLPDFLKKKKQVFIFADIMGDYRACIENIKICAGQTIAPWEYFLSLGDILEEVLRILFYKVLVPKPLNFFGQDVSDLVKNELSRTYNGITIFQSLNYLSARRFFKHVPVETFLLTYESNPWERMCSLAIRQFSAVTKILGYQHNVVPQSSANMFPSRREESILPGPSVILTTGDIPRKIMTHYGHFNGTRIDPACALRQEYLFHLKRGERKNERRLLLGLEGIFDVYHLVNYVLREIGHDKRYQITIRTHPVLPLKLFRHKLQFNLDAMDNVVLSRGVSLKDDIDRSDIVIYWGSTVSMEALWMGKPVIHYDNGSMLSFDPLFDCPHLKWTVSRNDSLPETLRRIGSLDDGEFERERQAAADYLRRYFYPAEECNFQKFLV